MEDNYYKGKSEKFFKFYRIYIAIITILLVGVLGFLWIKLAGFQKDYEKSSLDALASEQANSVVSDEEKDKIAQSCFQDYVSKLTIDDWINIYYEAHPDKFDDFESVKEFINDKILNSGSEYYKAPDFSLESPMYYFIKDEKPLVSVSLVIDGIDYKVNETKILISGEESLNVTIPSDCQLMINGEQVSDSYIVEKGIAVGVDDYNDELVNPVSCDLYTISSLISEPEAEKIKVKSLEADGKATLSDDGNYYKILDNVSAIEYQNKAEDFIKSLLAYYTKGKENAQSNMNDVLSHVASGSKASKVINDSYSGIVWTTADSSVNYVLSHSDVYVLADNCYCVDVKYRDDNSENQENPGGVYRVYFLDKGNGFGIVNFAGIK